MSQHDLEPKLLTVLREGYSRQQLLQDVLAGIVVGVVALPLAIAFAIASGVRPEQGLITAILAGIIVSVLGGTRVQIAGPTGAFIVIVYGVVQRYGYDGLAVATFMAGILLVAIGLARLGAIIRFIPYPVTVGFTSGIAIIIAAGQLRHAMGLSGSPQPPEFLAKLAVIARESDTFNAWTLALTIATIAIIRLWPRVTGRIPGPLIALAATTAVVHWFELPVETIGTRFGSVPSGLPMPRLPHVDWATLSALGSSAVSIALLGGIESLLSAVVADGMTGRKHRSNAELVAQGVANIVSPLFVVAYNMSEWHLFVGLLRGPRSDVAVLLVTFLLTVLVDLTVAIQTGVVLAALLLMHRMAEVTQVRSITDQLHRFESDQEESTELPAPPPPGVEVFEISGAFVFGAAQKFSQTISEIKRRPRVVILRTRQVVAMDATGLRGLEEVLARLQRQGTVLLLSGVQPQPLEVMTRSGLVGRIGEGNVLPNFERAVARARELLNKDALPGLDEHQA